MINKILILLTFISIISFYNCSSDKSGKKDSTQFEKEKAKVKLDQETIASAINDFDSFEIYEGTSIASSDLSVFGILSEDSRLLYFYNKREALPALRINFLRKRGSLTEENLIKYFTVFGICKDTLMVSGILEYVEENKGKSMSELAKMYNPYYYAVLALEIITNIKVSDAPFSYIKEADDFIKRVKVWQVEIKEKSEMDSIVRAINSLDSFNLRQNTGHASTQEVVFLILQEECKAVLFFKERKDALPALRNHFLKKNNSLSDDDRVKYFTTFGVCKDTMMVNFLLTYVKENKNKSLGEVYEGYDPYYFSVHALEIITQIQVADLPHALLLDADNFIKKIEVWQTGIKKK